MRLLAVLLALGCLGVTGASARSAGLGIVKVGHFESPVYATSTPSEPGKLYVVEQAGRIMVRGSTTPFLDIRSIVKSGGELGLLSMAFDPAYATNHRFYVDYTDVNGDTRVVRYLSDGTTGNPHTAKLCSSSRTSRRTTTAVSCSSAPTVVSTGGTATAARRATREETART